MTEAAYAQDGDWTKVVVRATRKGWMVDRDIKVAWETAGIRVLVPYGGDFQRGQNLREAWNGGMTYGDALIARANDCRRDAEACAYYHARVLRRGMVVH